MNSVCEFEKYPICDTDIWVNLCLGKITDELFAVHKKLVVADVVEGEISKWKNRKEYSYIYEEFVKNKNQGRILVINHEEHIVEDDRKLLELQLYELGFKNDFLNKPPEHNKGEYVSAIYADYFGILLMKSNDGAFSENGQGRIEFPDLEVRNWNFTVRDLVKSDKKRYRIINEVEKKNKEMNQEIKIKNEVAKNESIEEKLLKLQKKFSKNY